MSSKPIEAHQSHPDLKVPDPYRLFFPIGIFFGLIGVSVWPMLAMGWISYPTPTWHVDLMIQGFLFAFILGFLLTALPRFSQTWPITKSELVLFLVVFTAGNTATLMKLYAVGKFAYWINLTLIFVFAFRRFSKRGAHPPPEFVFVGVGLIVGWIAAWIRADVFFPIMIENHELMGRRLIAEGMVLMLVMGIAGKLAPMFFGFSRANPLTQLGNASAIQQKIKLNLVIALVLVGTFWIEYGLDQVDLALYLRAIAASFVFLGTMKIHQKPLERGMLVQALRWSNWAILLGLWGAAIHPQYRVEVLHVLFIGGFGMMILAIATRVILSHGKYPVEHEKNSPWLGIAAWVLFLSLMIRSVSTLTGRYYFSMLGLAGGLWIVGLLIWGWYFIPRAVRINSNKT